MARPLSLKTGVQLSFDPHGIVVSVPGRSTFRFDYPSPAPYFTLLVLAARENNLERSRELLAEYKGIPAIREAILVCRPGLDLTPLQAEPALKVVEAGDPGDVLAVSMKEGLRALSPRSHYVVLCLANQPLLPARELVSLMCQAEGDREHIIVPVRAGLRGHPLLIPRARALEMGRFRKEPGVPRFVRRYSREVAL